MSLKKAEVIYLWFGSHEMRNNGFTKKVQDTIKSHDFDAFVEIKKKYHEEYGLAYFPGKAFVFFDDEVVGEIKITNKNGFVLIDRGEFECETSCNEP